MKHAAWKPAAGLLDRYEQQRSGGFLSGDTALCHPPAVRSSPFRPVQVRPRKARARLAEVADGAPVWAVLQQPRVLLSQDWVSFDGQHGHGKRGSHGGEKGEG